MRPGLPFAIVLLLAALAGLGIFLRGDPAMAVEGAWIRPLDQRRDDRFPRSFRAASGEVSIARPPRRIVAGSVLTAEVLIAACPPERLAAIHRTAADPRFCAVAEQVRGFPRLTSGDPEDILSHAPDLVLTDSFTKAETQALLEAAGVTVVRTPLFATLADLQDNVRAIGYVTGLDAEVEALITGMQGRLEEVAEGAAGRRHWRLLDLNAAMYVSGAGSTFDSLLSYVGATNVAGERGVGEYLKVDAEQVLAWDPDVLVVPAEPGREADELRRIRQDPGLRILSSVQDERVLFVPSALLGSTSHHVADAARVIAEQLDAWDRR